MSCLAHSFQVFFGLPLGLQLGASTLLILDNGSLAVGRYDLTRQFCSLAQSIEDLRMCIWSVSMCWILDLWVTDHTFYWACACRNSAEGVLLSGGPTLLHHRSWWSWCGHYKPSCSISVGWSWCWTDRLTVTIWTTPQIFCVAPLFLLHLQSRTCHQPSKTLSPHRLCLSLVLGTLL